MVSLLSPPQRFAKLGFVFAAVILLKWLFYDKKPFTSPGEIAHPAIIERLTFNSPLSGQPLDTRRRGVEYLQMRTNRDETDDLFTNDILGGYESFWERFQVPWAKGVSSHNSDDETVRSAVDELLGFNGWAAAACSSLTRPFGASKKDDDWADLAGPEALYYFALVVHGADHFLIDQLAVIVQLSRRLGPNKIFVSLVDYASSDSTPFLCDMAEAVMTLLGISFRIVQIPPMTSDPIASYYPLEEAYTRNLALVPLHELEARRQITFTRVIWLKGFTCPDDILETLRISFKNDASMVCSMDWKEHNGFFIYNDRWRTRDMDGNLFRGSKSTSPIDEAPPRDPYGGARYTLHLPFQVFCCESGAHIVDPHKSYYEGVTYQSSVAGVFNTSAAADGKTPKWSEGPCMDSSQLHFCRDMWMVAFRAGIKEEAERLVAKERSTGVPRVVHPFMDELIQAMQASYGKATSDLVGYPNSGDYLAEETGAAPGGGPGMNNDMGGGGSSNRGELEEEEGPFEDEIDAAGGAGAGAAAVPVPAAAALPIAVVPVQQGVKVGAVAAAAIAAVEAGSPAIVDPADKKALPPVVAAAAKAKKPMPAPPPVGGEAKKAPVVVPVVEVVPLPLAADIPVVVAPVAPLIPVVQVVEAPPPTAEIPLADAVAAVPLQKRGVFASPPVAAESTSHLEKRRARSLPNVDFDYAVARIIVNPRCVTTYAGVSHTKLARDLFGSGEDEEPDLGEGGKYVLDEWRTPPESFVCQEMRTTGGRIAAKQQRRTGFQQSRLLLNGWRPT